MPQTVFQRKSLTIALLLATLTWIAGCHTLKKAEKAPGGSVFGNQITERKVLKEMEARYIDFQTLSAKVKISLQNDHIRQNNITAFLRMKKDSIIWISVRPILGIEMARVVITPDSIKLLNNLKQTVYLKGAGAIDSILKMPMDFHLLQNLLIGNPAFIPDKIPHLNIDSSAIFVTLANAFVSNQYKWSLMDFLLQSSHSRMKDSNWFVEQQYSDYNETGPYQFSFGRNIDVQAKEETHIQLQFEQVNFNQQLSFPFHYNPRYKIL